MNAETVSGAAPTSERGGASLEELFEAHRPRLMTMVGRRLDPRIAGRIDAEDVLSEAYLVARRKWPHFSTAPTSPYAWLYRIALDCLIEAWRRECRELRAPDREIPWPDRSSEQLAMGLLGSLTTPSEAMARGELEARVRQALDGLPGRAREVLWMKHFDGLSHREIASVLEITEEAATKRYCRALTQIKDLWRDLYGRERGAP